MAKTKATKSQKPVKADRPVAIDQQNPASTNVQLLIKSLKKRKERSKS